MPPKSVVVPFLALAVLALAAQASAAKPKDKDKDKEKPPLDAWSAVWHTAAVVEYSSCPGTEPGHQEAFTLAVKASEKAITATEQPEQSLPRKLTGTPDLRGKQWVLELRSADGKNGMDVHVTDDGKLAGTRVIVRSAGKRKLCSVVYSLDGQRP